MLETQSKLSQNKRHVEIAAMCEVPHLSNDGIAEIRGVIPARDVMPRVWGIPADSAILDADSELESNSQGTEEELRTVLAELEARRRHESRLFSLYPDEGPLRRELYPKHLNHFAAGRLHRERLFLAGNRVGKSMAAGYEGTLHLTGLYPAWWEGKVFDRPVNAIGSSDTAKTTRDIIQKMLFGPPIELGTGLVPKDMIVKTTPKHGLAEAYDIVYIRHVSGGLSRLMLKSYDQGVDAYKGTEEDVVWLDEEPTFVIKTECCIRTMTTGGIVIVTTTPIFGRTPMIDEFLKTCVNKDELPIAA